MKKLLLLLLLLGITGRDCMSQTLFWEHLFPENRVFMTLQNTLDGNLITSGVQHGPVQYPSNIAKYDISGNLLWKRNGKVMHSGEEDLKQLSDGTYLFVGNIYRNYPGNYRDTYLQSLDENGDTTFTWSQTYNEPSWDYPTEMILLDSGDILIAGLQLAPSNYTLRRTDSLGNTIWYKKYANSFNTYGTRMILNQSGNIVLLGMTRPSSNPWHPYLLEINTNGDSLYSKQVILKDSTVQEATNRIYNNLIQTSDGGYAFGGVFTENGYIAKTDSAFNLLWQFELQSMQQLPGISRVTFKIVELQDSSLLFLSKDVSPLATEFYVTRLSKEGDSISTTAIQSGICPGGNMQPYNWQFLADSSVVICGWCVSNQQAYIGRWGNLNYPLPMGFFNDTATVSAPEVLKFAKASLGQSYPNPTTETATIPYTLPKGVQAASIELRDLVTGRTISKYNLPTREDEAELPVSLRNVAAGVYVYTLTINGHPAGTKKMVLTR